MPYTPSDPSVSALIRLCEKEGGYENVANKSGLNKDHLWQIISGVALPSGNPRGIGPKSRLALTSAFPNWLVTGNGSMRTESANVTESSIGYVPLLSWVRAGEFCDAPNSLTKEDAEEWLPAPLQGLGKGVFALEVRGDSMDAPTGYREGEFVYIDPNLAPTHGKDVLARLDSGLTLKRYKVDEEGAYLLQLNGNKIIRPEAEWHVCGVVVFSGQRR